jgi:predicted PurR-regulated permease PerM
MSDQTSSVRITITTASLLRIIAVLLGLYFAYLISDILVLLFATVIFTSAIDPSVDWMNRKGIPRGFGILIIYLVLLGVIGAVVYLIIPPIITQFGQLGNDLPMYVERFNEYLGKLRNFGSDNWVSNIKNSLSNSSSGLPSAANSIFSTLFSFFGGIFSFVIILVITFYMVAEENSIRKLVWSLTPERNQHYVMDLLTRMQKKIGLWMRGQLILCVVIFLLTYIGLTILGVKYALVLALIAGLTEFIPYLGPIIGAIPAVFLAFSQSPMHALLTAILYLVIQQIENNFLVPKVMQKTAGLNPIISIVALMIGFSLGGVLGALLAIPVTTAGMVLVEDLINNKYLIKSKESTKSSDLK